MKFTAAYDGLAGAVKLLEGLLLSSMPLQWRKVLSILKRKRSPARLPWMQTYLPAPGKGAGFAASGAANSDSEGTTHG